ncbi:Ribosomal RNA-processing protein 7 A [Daphnia magna]|uniref:Ribosomal RNA-processing protein 7 A n=1 Tax=Daphnia magna TaxID=35525 RepID=A0A164VLV7_9CRUS|nr:Ribosomal RNA-processing protein 7 A [Daphnia magna]
METEKLILVQGFRCIETRFNEKCKAGHMLFYKEHAVRNSHPSKPVGKTLFILNVPPYYTEGFKVGYVVYKEISSLKKAMKMKWQTNIFSTNDSPIKTGLEKWISEYESSFIDPKELQSEIDNYMKEFDDRKKREEEEEKLKEGQPDNDGWIT